MARIMASKSDGLRLASGFPTSLSSMSSVSKQMKEEWRGA